MSIDFIKTRVNSKEIAKACKQQKQLSYFTQSKIQDDISLTYLTEWANRKYESNDFFLNWVKSIFKTENFLSFFKYLRNPLPSAKLVNNDIKPQLKRVFFSEDSYARYIIRGKELEKPKELDSDSFNEKIFNALLFNHNAILITDLKETNKPIRYLIDIDDVVSIYEEEGVITKIAFEAEIETGFGEVHGYAYMDDKEYLFYDKDYSLLIQSSHDLGVCPADFITKENFADSDIVKESIFSYIKYDLEEYNFLKTLQRMSEANGVLPVVTMLQVDSIKKEGQDLDDDSQPMASNTIGSQQATIGGVQKTSSPMQAGTIMGVPVIKKEDGSVDMELVKNFINFFYIPTECLEFLNKRIQECEQSILLSAIGDYQEGNESAKNEMQVSKGYVSKQDKLRDISLAISRVRNLSDYKFLSLIYGNVSVEVDVFLGSDFFLETQIELYELFKNAPNPIERKNILIKSSQNKNRFNKTKAKREKLLYELLPFGADIDFERALAQATISQEVKVLQTQFNYYVALFEAKYGDILQFYLNLNASESEKIILINNLLMDLIKVNAVQIEIVN